MASQHNDFIASYVPSELSEGNLSLLSGILIEWRDYKFSNGFYWVGLDRGKYINREIIDALDRLDSNQIKELLDNLNHIDKELFTLAQKVFTNTASQEEFYRYIEILEKTDVMQCSWRRFSQVQRS